MNSLVLLIGTLLLFSCAFRWYGRFLNRLFQINAASPTPAHTCHDGVDFVPAKNWLVLFGHHFSSICGAGPIIGPVLAVAYWGWAPSLIWIVVGAMLMGAVADYASLVVSMRSGGRAISEIAGPEVSPRARLLFSVFIWLSLILIIAVFALFGAKTLIEETSAVAPSMGLIPIAIITGWLLYRRGVSTTIATVFGLGALLFLLWLGYHAPVGLPAIGPISAQNGWIIILLLYCAVASIAPVNILLQPRDYLAAYLLFATIGIGVLAVCVEHPDLAAPFHAWNPADLWPGAGPLFPMLFVTIACGAISGFHSLVSSGTTSKQIAEETHCCRIGYGGMLTEGLVGVLVLICAAGALTPDELGATLHTAGPIAAFSEGYGRLSAFLLGPYGKPFAVLALNAFILTTLDTATRIARYLTTDLFRIRNKYAATGVVVLAAGALAVTGQWQRIWPAFGTANQLIAGLSLLVTACWLIRRGKRAWPVLIPALLMLVITTAAFVLQCAVALRAATPDYFIAGVSAVLVILSLVIFCEAWGVIRRTRGGGTRDDRSGDTCSQLL